MQFYSEGFDRLREGSAAVHDGYLHIKGGPIAMPQHIQQSGLRPAEIEVIDDMQNPDHREQACEEGFDVYGVVVPLAHEARAFVLCGVERLPSSPAVLAAPRESRSKSPAAQRPA